MVVEYRQLISGYNLTKTTSGIEGTKVYIESDPSDCTIANLPELGDPFNVQYSNCLLRSIQEVTYHQDHSVAGADKNRYKYVLSYSTEPDERWLDELQFTTTYSGGTTAISLDLKNKASQWHWLKDIRDTSYGSQILKRQVYIIEAKGTYTYTLQVPQVETDTYYSWGTFLTGDGGPDSEYGIINSIGKINSVEVAISPTSGETKTFQKGQVLFTSFDCKAGVSSTGRHIWNVNLNFAYRVVNLDADNQNVEYPWLYLINDQAESGDNQYQVPVHNTPGGAYADDLFLYNFADFNSSLDPLK